MSASKVVVVTGSSGGFGRRMVDSLAGAGHTVIATMREPDGRNRRVASDIRASHANVSVVELDVTDDRSVVLAAEKIGTITDRVDVVINNAGILSLGLCEAHTAADCKRIFDVNVHGVVRVNNAFLPGMRARGDGLLITISSIQGRVVLPFSGAYTASKWAVEGLAESYRYELAPLGIDSVVIEPGAFPTTIASSAQPPSNQSIEREYGPVLLRSREMGEVFERLFRDGPGADPQEVADAVLKVIDTPRGQRPFRVVVGSLLTAATERINAACDDEQRRFMASIAMDDLAGREG